jgi:hypothetical protein
MKRGLRPVAKAALSFCIFVLCACHVDQSFAPTPPQTEFGIFFGSQIQQRLEIPLELDATRQQQGFRVRFGKPTLHPMTISWELDYPTARSGPRGPGNAPRAQRKSSAVIPAGADRFEQRITLTPKDYPGTWNVRVLVDNQVVLDRPFRLVSTRAGGR